MGTTTVFMTHDLEEAVRSGDRIAIMKECRFVQGGPPAESIMHPADSFVAEFVMGISRMYVVNADRLMMPVEAFLAETGLSRTDLATLESARVSSSLHELVDIAAKNQQPIAIYDDGKIVGVVPLRTLFEAMKEGRPA